MSKKILHLNLKKKWFDQVKSGEKTEELRLIKPYWEQRLHGRTYDEIHIRNGYEKGGEILRFRWNGYTTKMITHEEFGAEAVPVFVIDLSEVINNE